MNNKGFALVTVIIFGAAALILALSMFYVSTKSTKLSGTFKQFNTLKEVADTGVNLAVNIINNKNKNNILGYELKNNNICGSFDEYLISNPDNETCKSEAENKPWLDITENNFNLKVYIIKVFQSHIAGAGGAASFPPQYGKNFQNYQYYLRIISKAEDLTSKDRITAEALYRYSF